jgi:hypothetical protein
VRRRRREDEPTTSLGEACGRIELEDLFGLLEEKIAKVPRLDVARPELESQNRPRDFDRELDEAAEDVLTHKISSGQRSEGLGSPRRSGRTNHAVRNA